MGIFYRLFVAYLVATPYILFTNGDDIQTEIDADTKIRQSLDEISKEVNAMKAELNKLDNNVPSDSASQTVSDGGDTGGGRSNGNSPRAALGEIEKVKQIVELLETIVLPTIVDHANVQDQAKKKEP